MNVIPYSLAFPVTLDLMLSVPLISAVVTPSWSTYMNIIFFWTVRLLGTLFPGAWLTVIQVWSSCVFAHDAWLIHTAALLASRGALWLLPSLIFLAFDALLPSLAASVKFAGKAAHQRQPLKLLGVAVVNMLLVTGVEAALSYGCFLWTRRPLFKTTTTMPYPMEMFRHNVVLFAGREVVTYYLHRFLLHDAARSPRLTRLHKTWAHANPCSSLQLYADHPVPLLLLHLAPVLLPSLALRPHVLTYMLFTALCTFQGTLTNSGYTLVPGIILGGIARRTSAHYACGGSANFGAWGVLDWIHGTSKGGDVLEDAKDEADKHNVKERSSAKVGEGASMLQDGVDAVKDGVTKRRSSRKRT